MKDKLITVAQASEIAGVSVASIRCIFRTHTDTVFENIRTVISELSGH